MSKDSRLLGEFLADSLGQCFEQFVRGGEMVVLDFLAVPCRVRRMMEAEVFHDRPALAGVVLELESDPAIAAWLAEDATRSEPRRRNQYIGAVVRFILRREGWTPTGRRTTLGLSSRVGKAERYRPPESFPGHDIWWTRHPDWEFRKVTAPQKKTPEETGRTRAQRLRDAIRWRGPTVVGAVLRVRRAETVENWLRQARRDDGDDIPRGRGTQPALWRVEYAEEHWGRVEPRDEGD